MGYGTRTERAMVPSPKVPTYDLQPEMNAAGVAEDVAKTVATGTYEFVMCNFAPPDMVGHTGVLEAATKGVEATDTAIGVILEACKAAGYALFITSDHGNAEVMLTEDGKPVTSHTTNNVPFIAFDPAGEVREELPPPPCEVVEAGGVYGQTVMRLCPRCRWPSISRKPAMKQTPKP